ncbi:hypothetical protein GH714_043982 [Hevea brasiliensis]|uniref:Uncharacterized protein n=1 Tax=Hevea brasiliensis TaxID=3981 RepID=A0A6A6K1S3_HEVBR|nr:hypothetical protein GH714_043982 [Hevea brasiliensis]
MDACLMGCCRELVGAHCGFACLAWMLVTCLVRELVTCYCRKRIVVKLACLVLLAMCECSLSWIRLLLRVTLGDLNLDGKLGCREVHLVFEGTIAVSLVLSLGLLCVRLLKCPVPPSCPRRARGSAQCLPVAPDRPVAVPSASQLLPSIGPWQCPVPPSCPRQARGSAQCLPVAPFDWPVAVPSASQLPPSARGSAQFLPVAPPTGPWQCPVPPSCPRRARGSAQFLPVAPPDGPVAVPSASQLPPTGPWQCPVPPSCPRRARGTAQRLPGALARGAFVIHPSHANEAILARMQFYSLANRQKRGSPGPFASKPIH